MKCRAAAAGLGSALPPSLAMWLWKPTFRDSGRTQPTCLRWGGSTCHGKPLFHGGASQVASGPTAESSREPWLCHDLPLAVPLDALLSQPVPDGAEGGSAQLLPAIWDVANLENQRLTFPGALPAEVSLEERRAELPPGQPQQSSSTARPGQADGCPFIQRRGKLQEGRLPWCGFPLFSSAKSSTLDCLNKMQSVRRDGFRAVTV